MSETETTSGAFDLFLKANGTAPRNPKNAGLPVVNVAFSDAENYCKWIGGRLPTSAEWEYAAHGGKNFAYPNGDDISKSEAHFGLKQNLAPVKSYEPNGYGLYEMVGNVAEMVQGPLLKGGHHLSSKGDLRISSGYAPNRDGKNENNGFRCVISTGK
jgi:formylglycine-generating enzyme required for sulfatase activity